MDGVTAQKYTRFLENAQLLGRQFGIRSLLYGSLGLEVLLDRQNQKQKSDAEKIRLLQSLLPTDGHK